MSGKHDDEAAVRVGSGVLKGIKGDYRIVGKLCDGEQAIVIASLSAFPSALSNSYSSLQMSFKLERYFTLWIAILTRLP